ncbi:MAG: sulfatase-like hydrolase/transferase [Planctomycetota bacterium]
MKSERSLIATSMFALVTLALLAPSVTRAENVLLLIADDFGVDSCGLYSGAGAAPTPNIDALAAGGIRFTEFWANPICSPTRAAILTGRHGFRTGVGSPTGNHQIGLNEYTIADLANAAGHQTACIGKWHLSGNQNGGNNNPNLMGFTTYSGATGGGVPNFFAWNKVTNGASSPVTNYATSETVDDARDWITAQGSDPWFCWVAFNAPHSPFHLPPSELHSYDALSGTQADIDANPLPYYQAAVEAMDTEIGRLLNSIDSDVLADTTIIFIGDNGSPGEVATDFERGQKGLLFQGGVHVPCIVAGASVAAPLGRTNDAILHVSDLFATIAEIVGADLQVALPDGVLIDSRSFLPYMLDADLPIFHDVTFAERFTVDGANQDGKTVRNTRYKLIRFDNGNERFFDLQQDPLETTNLSIGNNNGPRVQNYNALTAFLDGLLASPQPPRVESMTVNEGDAQRSIVDRLTVTLNTPAAVDATNGSPFVIRHRLTDEIVDHQLQVERVDGKTRVHLTFVPGDTVSDRGANLASLDDGNYDVTLDASKITYDIHLLDGNADGIGGDDHVFGDEADDGFFRFFGDSDGDRDVDGQDFGRLFSTFFRSLGQVGFDPTFDYDGDNDVDGQDYGQFTSRFFQTLNF